MRILYQFPLSPYCEKVRWILDYKELQYTAQNLRPGLHRAFAQLKTKNNTLPILRDGDSWIGDSTQIAVYLDDIYPEHRIIRPQRHLHEEILYWNHYANDLGRLITHWCVKSVLEHDEYTLNILLGERGYARKFEKLTKPLLHKLLQRYFYLNEQEDLASQQKMKKMLNELNQIVAHKDAFLVGERLSLADMSICAMIAPLLQIAQTPWEKQEGQQFSQQFYDYQQQLLAMPIAHYVEQMYQNHRHALVDWRGVD